MKYGNKIKFKRSSNLLALECSRLAKKAKKELENSVNCVLAHSHNSRPYRRGKNRCLRCGGKLKGDE